MSGPPTQSVEVFPKKAGTYAQVTSTGNSDVQLLFAANTNRKYVEVWNLGTELGRVQHTASSPGHDGVPLYGALQQVTGLAAGPFYWKCEGTEAIYVKANAAGPTSLKFMGREV